MRPVAHVDQVPPQLLRDRGPDTVGSVLRDHAERSPGRPFLLFEREPGRVETTTWATSGPGSPPPRGRCAGATGSTSTGVSIALVPRFSASRWSEQARTLGATVAGLFAAPIRMILASPPTEHDAAHRAVT